MPTFAQNQQSENAKASEVLLALLVESAGLVIVVGAAGISDGIANMMLVFMVGLWLLFLIMHQSGVQTLSNSLTGIEKAASHGG